MEIISEMIWYASWPVIIYLSVKFVQLNLNQYKKMERLEELEEYYAQHEATKK